MNMTPRQLVERLLQETNWEGADDTGSAGAGVGYGGQGSGGSVLPGSKVGSGPKGYDSAPTKGSWYDPEKVSGTITKAKLAKDYDFVVVKTKDGEEEHEDPNTVEVGSIVELPNESNDGYEWYLVTPDTTDYSNQGPDEFANTRP